MPSSPVDVGTYAFMVWTRLPSGSCYKSCVAVYSTPESEVGGYVGYIMYCGI